MMRRINLTERNKRKILKKLCRCIDLLLIEEQNGFRSDIKSHVIYRKDKIKVEIRKETVSHHLAHMHILHSDQIDASICLNTFSLISGEIPKKILKKLIEILEPQQEVLLRIWDDLNNCNNEISVEEIIRSLPWNKTNSHLIKRKVFIFKRR